jgi:hypothetical protein
VIVDVDEVLSDVGGGNGVVVLLEDDSDTESLGRGRLDRLDVGVADN